jgi:diguanylate cyclase (GGDEF)-like protein/PAS domain S-box-containing protein
MLQVLAAESLLLDRNLRQSSPLLTWIAIALLGLLITMIWRRTPAHHRATILIASSAAIEGAAITVQVASPITIQTSLYHIAVLAYLLVIALDEIDFRSLLGSIAERRFQRIAMSVGDGLACADKNGLVTFWNPGASAIFGYSSEEIIGQPIDQLFGSDEASDQFRLSIQDLSPEALQVPGGRIIESVGRRKDGKTFSLEVCFSGWAGADGFHYGAVLRDISIRMKEAERIRYLATFDTLTGLANRNTLYEHLNATLAQVQAAGSQLAVMLLDLDKFKEINDTLGHAYGDKVICAVGRQLSSLMPDDAFIARLSGDEFAVVISGLDVVENAEVLARRVCSEFETSPLRVEDIQLRVRCSLGISVYPCISSTVDDLLGNADLALYRAKAQGGGKHLFFALEMRAELETRLGLEAELRRAVDQGEFELFFQPQVRLRDAKVIGAEALIRWHHPERGLVSPAQFMPVVNSSPISDEVANWVLRTACEQARTWQQEGYEIRVAVNLSPSQLKAGDLADSVRSVLEDTGLPSSLLELEVTEDILLDDDKRALAIFQNIQSLGVQIAFDDFGTGYASLSYLKKFPLNVLKIDQSFVRDLRPGTDDAAIVSSTIGLGKQLGLSVIAEGIESEVIMELLRGMGCEEGQGYYFGRPVPGAEFADLLRLCSANEIAQAA